jgi:sulfoxide reductase heme-binding subunit YedZ
MAINPSFHRVIKPAVFVLCLAPLGWLIWWGVRGELGANPIEATNRYLGDWALRFLLITLAATPLRGITGWNGVLRFRRMFGLYAFFYVCLHLSSYIGLDQFFDWNAIWQDIVKRNFITVGMVSFILLIPLAVTSTNAMVRRLGGKRWLNLHRLIYLIGIATCFHFYMMRKGVQWEPIIYGGVLALLLGYRAVTAIRRRMRNRKVPSVSAA